MVGDSLADGIWGGLYRRLYKDKRLTIYRGARNSVGFGSSTLLELVDQAFAAGKVDAVVMMVGANDRRGISSADGNTEAAYRSAQWADAYARRVDAFMKNVTERSVPLIWILLPVMREDDATADAKQINSLIVQTAQKYPNVKVVETWPLTVDESNAYAPYLKGPTGQSRLVRAQDGVHFTEVGYEMISDAAWATLLSAAAPIQLLLQQR